MEILASESFHSMRNKPKSDALGYANRKISVFIPVYKNSAMLEGLLEKLTGDPYLEKEIFTVIDKPSEEALRTVEKFRGRVHFILNAKRRGKVEALNEAVKFSSGEILVFLDSDVSLGDCKKFLEAIASEMREADILDIKKKIVKDSFISRMASYEYVSSNLASYLYSKLVGRCFAVGGAAFAIKRSVFEEVGGFSKVISEDLDLAMKVLLKNKRFKYASKIEVYTKAPSNWRGWLAQRRRWGIGTGLWIRSYGRKVIRYIAKYPHVALPCAIILFPTVIPMVFNYVCSQFPNIQLIGVVPKALASQLSFSLPSVISISAASILLTALTNLFLGFIVFSIIFYAASKKLKFHFNLAEFVIYYFFYQPIAFLILLGGIISAFLFSKHKLDWKV